MKVAIDLHIHSALSPCSDNDMTPNNIVNMASLKGLDIIAVTDHNSMENYSAIAKCAENANILAVPGMELETREEVHLICLFPGKVAAFRMQEYIYELLPKIDNRSEVFGQQIMMNEYDEIVGYHKNMLITAVNIGLDDACRLVKELGGVAIPAHIDRNSYSVISNLGLIPQHLDFKFIEISKSCNLEELLEKYSYLNRYNFIRSSDAHTLGNILERECFIELEELSMECLISKLGEGKNSD
ncbi:MAG: PHP domain-containing protein [Clostridia bacterium]|nr:PHP domain-containing protein [Clostridia bacterium]